MGPARDDETEGGRWGTPAEAARVLGLSADAVRKQIRQGKCRFPARRGNRATWEVLIPDALATVATVASERRATVADPRDAELVELRARVALLEALHEEHRAHLEEVRAERDRWHAEATRHRWPGVWPALVRVWRGEG